MIRRMVSGVALVAVLGAGCSGGRVTGGASHPAADERPPAPKARCDAPSVPVPEGFLLVRTTEREGPAGSEIHRTYRDEAGRRFDLLLGVAGEVGEGLPSVGTVDLASGLEARLLGRGRTWILVWEELPPCGQTAMIGNEVRRRAFLDLVEGTGLVEE